MNLRCAVNHLHQECQAIVNASGVPFGKRDYPALKNHLLIAVTEMNSKEEI